MQDVVVSRGYLIEAFAEPAEFAAISSRLRWHVRLIQDSVLAGSWIARATRFGFSLAHRGIEGAGFDSPPVDRTVLVEPFVPEPFEGLDEAACEPALESTLRAVVMRSLTEPPERREVPGFRPLALSRLLPRGGSRVEPLVLSRRDFRTGLTIGALRERARATACGELRRLGVRGESLLALPRELREAVLTAIAADPSGRVLEKLHQKPELLVAIGLAIGDAPARWAADDGLTPPLEAIARGEKERVVLEESIRHARLPMPSDAAKALRAHARALSERAIPLLVSARIGSLGLPPSCVPRPPAQRADWLRAFLAAERRGAADAALRYTALHGAALAALTTERDLSGGELAEIVDHYAEDALARGLGPRGLVRRLLDQPLLHRGPSARFERDGISFRWIPDRRALRELGERYQNCLRDPYRLLTRETPATVYFEASYEGGACVVSVDDFPGDHCVHVAGRENASLPKDLEHRVTRALERALEERPFDPALQAMPRALRAAIGTTLANDPTGRVLAKLRARPVVFRALGIALGERIDGWLGFRLEPRLPPPLERLVRGDDDEAVLASVLEDCLGLVASPPRLTRLLAVAEGYHLTHAAPSELRALLGDDFLDAWVPRSPAAWASLARIRRFLYAERPVSPETFRYLARYAPELSTLLDSRLRARVVSRLLLSEAGRALREHLPPVTLELDLLERPFPAPPGIERLGASERVRVEHVARRTDIHLRRLACLGHEWHQDGSPLDTGRAALFLASDGERRAAVLVLFDSMEALVTTRGVETRAEDDDEAPESPRGPLPAGLLAELRRLFGAAFGVEVVAAGAG